MKLWNSSTARKTPRRPRISSHAALSLLSRPDAPAFAGVANLGVRPTLGLRRCLLETHVIGDCPDLYGETVSVVFRHFLRPELRFESLDALAVQMHRDKADAVAIFAGQTA